MAGPLVTIKSKIGSSLLLTVQDDRTLVSRPEETPVSDNQLWKKVTLVNGKYKLFSKALNWQLKFAEKGRQAYVTGNEDGSEVVFPQHPNNFVKIKDSDSPQYVLGIAQSNTAPNTGGVSWDDVDIDYQLWQIIESNVPNPIECWTS